MIIAAALIVSVTAFVPPARPHTKYKEVPPPTKMYDAAAPMILYMNRHGGTFTCPGSGSDDATTNKSSIACGATNGTATVDAYAGSDAQWSTVLSCIQNLYAPFNLPVTDVQPIGQQYIEAVIGGSPDQVGESGGVAGVAPFSCAVEPGAVVYDFAAVWGNDLESICETAGQEVAHAFGLDHEFLCQDPMTYLTDCGNKTFQDEYVPCGEYEPRQCTCGDPTQNSVQSMLTLFGPADGSVYVPPADNAPPTVSLDSPADGDIVNASSPVVVKAHAHDDAGLTLIELQWDFGGEHMVCPAGQGTGDYTCTVDGDNVTWTIDPSVGSRTFRAHVRDIAGNDVTTPDRTVWLSPDGKGPPPDHGAPVVELGAPLSGAVLPTATQFDVVATMVDDTGIALAELNWQRRGVDNWIPCPYSDTRTTCVKDGSTYRWTLQSSREGDRTFQLRATDMVGNVTTTDIQTITLTAGAALPPSDGNDTLDQAKELGCGDTATLDGTSTDWFHVDTPAGSTVTVSVSGHSIAVATDGHQVLGQATPEKSSTVDVGSHLELAVLPSSATSGSSTVTVQCTPPGGAVKKPGAVAAACSSTDAPTTAFFAFTLAGLALVRRRR